MSTTRRHNLCEEHIAELAILQTKVVHLAQEVGFLSADIRKLTDLVVDTRTQLLLAKDRQKLTLSALAAAMGFLGSLGPAVMRLLLP